MNVVAIVLRVYGIIGMYERTSKSISFKLTFNTEALSNWLPSVANATQLFLLIPMVKCSISVSAHKITYDIAARTKKVEASTRNDMYPNTSTTENQYLTYIENPIRKNIYSY